MHKDYNQYSKEELIQHINELEKQLKSNKYGLYWDKNIEAESIVEKCKDNIPYLYTNNSKKINNTSGQSNILIEGDNFASLTCLNMIASESIDVIYIDPPYNTGHEDFIYNDKFINDDDGYLHSKWLNFMNIRLRLAKNLLNQNGLIFISIDDREYANLKLLCDQIFGEKCFVANLKWKKKKQPSFLSRVAGVIEYILVYEKTSGKTKKLSIESLKDSDKPITNAGNQIVERYFPLGIRAKCSNKLIKAGKYQNKSMILEFLDDINIEKGRTINAFRCRGPFRTSQEYINNFCKEDLIFITSNLGLRRDLSTDEKGSNKSITDLLLDWEQNQDGSNQLKSIFNITTNNLPFNNPKPVLLIKNCIKSTLNKNAIVLDFFAGSGTTGQAVLELNKEDGGNRKFILCTNNENGICENVTYERLKTVITGTRKDGSKYSEGIPANLVYMETSFIEDQRNSDQAKYNLVDKLDGLICMLEDTFIKVDKNTYFSHYQSNDGKKHTFIYFELYSESVFEVFKYMVANAAGEKVVYIFSYDNQIDETLFSDSKDVIVKPIPEKIYEIYKEIVEDIKRGE